MHRPVAVPSSLAGGRYVLQGRLGTGATAVVYAARDVRLGVRRAIKILNPPPEVDRKAVSNRLRAEARAMAQLAHPNVVTVHDIAVEGPFEYIVMEFAPGGALLQRLYDHGPLPAEHVVHWMLDILSALAFAHANGIVHRDVKPGNILLDEQDRALLADFGIAMLADLRRTRTGQGLGSMGFMPPQQRLDASSVTHHADVYAVGATVYYLVSGENPIDLFLADADSPRWRRLDPRLAEVVRKACAQEPEDRYASAGELALALWELYPDERPLDQVGPGSPRFPVPVGVDELTTRSPSLPDTETPAPEDRPTLLPPRSKVSVAGVVSGVLAVLVALLIVAQRSPRSDEPVVPDPQSVALVPPSEPRPSGEAEALPSGPPPPEVAPTATKRSPPRPPAKPAPRTPPEGSWVMSRNGVRVELELRRDGAHRGLRGTVTSSIGRAKQVEVDVEGGYDAGSRRLWLTEVDAPSTRYEIELDPDLSEGRGTVRVDGAVRSLVLSLAE